MGDLNFSGDSGNSGTGIVPRKRFQPPVLPMPAIDPNEQPGAQPDGPPNPFEKALAMGTALGNTPPDTGAAPTPTLGASPEASATVAQGTPRLASASQNPQEIPAQHKPFFSTAERGIKNPVLRTLAQVGDVAGSLLFPGQTALIPGTRLNEERGQNRELAQQKEQAETAEKTAQAAHQNAEASAAGKPKTGATPEEVTLHDLMTGENGQPRVNPDTGKPYSYLEAYAATKQASQDVKPEKPEKPNDFEQFYADYIKDNNIHDSAHNRLMARKAYAAAGQAPQHDQRQLAVGPDGKVIELKPGMIVPAGSKTMAGDLATPKPNADEQKRADLVENLNENLDQLEDIVKRRPDLFGKVAGRMTKGKEWLGSDDPDVAALKGIEDRLGMVAQSSHGMRSAHHVEASANSIINSYKNGADAMLRAISDARKSGSTFTKDVENKTGSGKKGAEDHGGIHIERDANGRIIGVK